MKAKRFLNGLKPQYITQLAPLEIQTYAEMVRKAQLLEDATDFTDRIKGKFVKKEMTSGPASAKPTIGKKRPFNITEGSSQERKPKVFVPNTPTKSHYKHCDKPGHTADECRPPDRDCSICRFLGPDCHSLPVTTKKATGTQASSDEELLASGRPEGRKKVQPLISCTAENTADKGVATYITHPGRSSQSPPTVVLYDNPLFSMDHFRILSGDSLPIGLLEDVAQPSAATLSGHIQPPTVVDGQSRPPSSPGADDPHAQFSQLQPHLSPDQVLEFLAAAKGKSPLSPPSHHSAQQAASSAPAISAPHVPSTVADPTPFHPWAIHFSEPSYLPAWEVRPKSPPVSSFYQAEPASFPRKRSYSLEQSHSLIPAHQATSPSNFLVEWTSMKRELHDLRRQLDPWKATDIPIPSFQHLRVPPQSKLPVYRRYSGVAEKIKPDEEFAVYADRWRALALIVCCPMLEEEKVKLIIANAIPTYRAILAMNDITSMHQLYSLARFIHTQLKDSPIHSMFETPMFRYPKKPQGPVTEVVQTNEQVGAVNNPYGSVESLADIFTALMSLNALRLPPEKANWNMAADQTMYCVYHHHSGHNIAIVQVILKIWETGSVDSYELPVDSRQFSF
ncbi:hypothetical protein Taro_017792 [Colocasia esculenta]|uniref:Uncharacterized protein n=1 Tax=Colocasia esculenta TaxID=4460 RepID=A0A843US85_COLES|nr:hypothetical protein [Colocasia esculenta]